jgi:hypothetical protein
MRRRTEDEVGDERTCRLHDDHVSLTTPHMALITTVLPVFDGSPSHPAGPCVRLMQLQHCIISSLVLNAYSLETGVQEDVQNKIMVSSFSREMRKSFSCPTCDCCSNDKRTRDKQNTG